MKRDLANVIGVNLQLRLIVPDDADYVYALRTDPRYNAYLSPVKGTVADQRHWIERYKSREAAGQELYYVIERRDGIRCGVVRLYEVGEVCFSWGSWILGANKPSRGAFESAFLVYRVGFDFLQCGAAVFDVRTDNLKALAFHRRFGANEVERDDENVYFEYRRERYLADRERFHETLYGTKLR